MSGSSTSRATPPSRRVERRWHAACLVLSTALAAALLSLGSCRRFDACGFDGLPCDERDAPPSSPMVPSPRSGGPPSLQHDPRVPSSPLDAGDAGDAGASADAGDGASHVDRSLVDGVPVDRDASPPSSTDAAPPPAPDAAVPVGVRDDQPPRLDAMSPADGDGPITSERVSLRFSEAMDASSVEAAFPTGEGFIWSDDGSSLEFRLPLPFGEAQESHAIVVPAGVRDLEGNPLGADVEARVTLAALARVTLPLNFGLTGNQIQGGNANASFLQAGDASGGGIYFGAASFSLADLPSFAQNLGLRRATLQLQICGIAGDPGGALGGFEVARVSFATRAVIDEPIVVGEVGPLLEAGPISPGQLVQLDVAAPLAAAWSEGQALVQFRFAPRTSNFNGVSDLIYLRRVVDENDVVVSAGVLDPDPDNAARIEVEYFH
jgi:hypothetical protein